MNKSNAIDDPFRLKQRAFTLVEILIVVVIMAVLAAVVVPLFDGSTDDAKRSTAKLNLSSFRSVIQSSAAHHGGITPALPSGATSIDALTSETDRDGKISSGGGFGPYLIAMPENPFTGNATVKSVATPGTKPLANDVTANNAGGWIYDSSTGGLWLDSNTDGEYGW